MNYLKINNYEAISLILVIFINHLILSFPQSILTQIGSSSIIAVIYVTFFALLFVFLISKFSAPFNNKDILDISEFLGGKRLKTIVGIVSLIYLIFASSILIRDFTDFLKLVHFYKFPIYFILIFFFLTGIIGNFFGKRSTFRANLIVIFITSFGLIISFCSLIPKYEIERIFPLLGNGGTTTFLLSLSNLSAFSGLFFLFFLKPYLNKNSDFFKVGSISICIMGIFLLLSVASLLLVFPISTQIKDLSPLYYITSISGNSSFFQRPESIFMLTWILTIMSYTTITITFSIIILEKLSRKKLSKGIALPVAITIYILALLPKNTAIVRYLHEYIYTYFSVGILMVFFFLILIIAFIKYQKKKKYIQ